MQVARQLPSGSRVSARRRSAPWPPLCEGCRRLIHSGPKASSRYTWQQIIAAVPMDRGQQSSSLSRRVQPGPPHLRPAPLGDFGRHRPDAGRLAQMRSSCQSAVGRTDLVLWWPLSGVQNPTTCALAPCHIEAGQVKAMSTQTPAPSAGANRARTRGRTQAVDPRRKGLC